MYAPEWSLPEYHGRQRHLWIGTPLMEKPTQNMMYIPIILRSSSTEEAFIHGLNDLLMELLVIN